MKKALVAGAVFIAAIALYALRALPPASRNALLSEQNRAELLRLATASFTNSEDRGRSIELKLFQIDENRARFWARETIDEANNRNAREHLFLAENAGQGWKILGHHFLVVPSDSGPLDAKLIRRYQADFAWLAIGVSAQCIQAHPATAFATAGLALDLARTTADQRLIGAALFQNAAAFRRNWRLADALANAQEALDHHHRLGEVLPEARARNLLGNVYADLGRIEDASREYVAALRGIEGEKNTSGLKATLIYNMGEILRRRNEHSAAFDKFREALTIHENSNDPLAVADCQLQIGNILGEMGAVTWAIELYSKALSVYEERKDLEGVSKAQSNLGVVWENLQQYDQAKACYNAAIDSALRAFSPLARSAPLFNLAAGKEENGALLDATVQYRQAISIVERVRGDISEPLSQAWFLSSQSGPHQRLVSCLNQMGQHLAAWETLETFRSRSLNTMLLENAQNRLSNSDGLSKTRLQELKFQSALSRSSLVELQKSPRIDEPLLESAALRLARTEQQYQGFVREASSKSGNLAGAHLEVQTPALETVSQFFGMNEALILQFSVSPTETTLITLSHLPSLRKTPRVESLGLPVSHVDLERGVSALREAIIKKFPDVRPQARDLYVSLLAPVRHLFEQHTNIYVLPDGPLWSLPFQTLVDETGRYLVETKSLVYAPSVSTLLLQQGLRNPNASLDASPNPEILVAADPSLNAGLHLAPIPGTRAQADRLAECFGSRVLVLSGSEATETFVRDNAKHTRILHLATHGDFNSANPLASGVFLARDGVNDGFWEAREILESFLGIDLVVLAACETGRGQELSYEGILGLPWALLASGVRAALVSQWKVSDAGTSELMVEFYKALLDSQKRCSVSSALRKAQLLLLRSERWSHPFYWAPFIQIGR